MSRLIFFCNLFVVLLFSFGIVIEGRSSSPAPVPEGIKGNCSCGGFPTITPDADATPILAQSTGLMIKCDVDGENTCKALCIALATATKAKGPEILCKRLKDTEELKLSAFYKPCDNPWAYANMTADEALCCRDSKVAICPSAEVTQTSAPTTLPVEAHTAV